MNFSFNHVPKIKIALNSLQELSVKLKKNYKGKQAHRGEDLL